MKSSPKHPNLREKLALLYSSALNPGISRDADLARALGISRQAIGKWIQGTSTSQGDKIPHNKSQLVGELFSIPAAWFALPFSDFESLIKEKILNQDGKQSFASSVKHVDISTSTMPSTETQLHGRRNEIGFLEAALEDEKIKLVQIVGFAGIGKSSVVNSWLEIVKQAHTHSVNKIFAWSFDWQSAALDERSSTEHFLQSALEWFGDSNSRQYSSWTKATRLAALVSDQPTIFILDAIESLIPSPNYNEDKINDPSVMLLIRELSSSMNGLCLITSRTKVSELDNESNPGCRTMEVKQLETPASVSLLKNKSIKGTDDELAYLATRVGNHPLSLNLLAGYLTTAYSGEISKLEDTEQFFGRVTAELIPDHIMAKYLDWFKQRSELAILHLLALASHKVKLSTLKDLSGRLAGSTILSTLKCDGDADWLFVVHKLEEAGLLSIEKQELDEVIDCHPIVKGFLSNYLRETFSEEWQQGHSALFDLLQNENPSPPKSIEEFENCFQIVRHGCLAGRFVESFQFYSQTIKQGHPYISPHGSHKLDLDCLRLFFEQPWTRPLSSLPLEAQFYLISCVATNLIHLGNIDDALQPGMIAINGLMQAGEWDKAANALAPMTSALFCKGDLDGAEKAIALGKQCTEKLANPIVDAGLEVYLGYIAYLRGDFTQAQAIFEKAFAVHSLESPPAPVTVPIFSYFHTSVLTEVVDPKLGLERALLAFEWRETHAWQSKLDTGILLALDHVALGYAYLRNGELTLARNQIDEGVKIFEATNNWVYLPHGLEFRGRLHYANKDLDLALEDFEHAVEISRYTGARLIEFNTLLDLTRLQIDMDDIESAVDSLNKAIALLDVNVYKFRNDEIEQLSAQLGID